MTLLRKDIFLSAHLDCLLHQIGNLFFIRGDGSVKVLHASYFIVFIAVLYFATIKVFLNGLDIFKWIICR